MEEHPNNLYNLEGSRVYSLKESGVPSTHPGPCSVPSPTGSNSSEWSPYVVTEEMRWATHDLCSRVKETHGTPLLNPS